MDDFVGVVGGLVDFLPYSVTVVAEGFGWVELVEGEGNGAGKFVVAVIFACDGLREVRASVTSRDSPRITLTGPNFT